MIGFTDIYHGTTTAHDVKLKIFTRRVEKFIDGLFQDAFFSGNDCYFWQVLLNFDLRGMGIHPVLLSEDWSFFQSLTDLIEKENNGLVKMRLALMVYCHIYESNLLPKMFRNLFMVLKDEAPNMGDFPLQRNRQEQTPEWKFKSIYDYSKNEEFNNLINEVYNKDIRNAFSHSDYVLSGEGMILKPERNMVTTIVDYDELSLTINKMFILYQIFMEAWDKYRKTTYKHGDFIKGVPNFGPMNIEITNDEEGNGFKTGNDMADKVSGEYLEVRKKNKPLIRARIRIQIGYVYNRPSYFDIRPRLPKNIIKMTFTTLYKMEAIPLFFPFNIKRGS